MGITNDEGDGVTNWSPTRGVNESLADAITTTFFNCQMAAEASFRALHGVPTWRYRYMGVFPSVTPYDWLGAYHQGACGAQACSTDPKMTFPLTERNPADIPFVFGSFPRAANASGPPPLPYETAASHYIQAAFASFIRDPVRGLEREMGWPRYNANGLSRRRLQASSPSR